MGLRRKTRITLSQSLSTDANVIEFVKNEKAVKQAASEYVKEKYNVRNISPITTQ